MSPQGWLNSLWKTRSPRSTSQGRDHVDLQGPRAAEQAGGRQLEGREKRRSSLFRERSHLVSGRRGWLATSKAAGGKEPQATIEDSPGPNRTRARERLETGGRAASGFEPDRPPLLVEIPCHLDPQKVGKVRTHPPTSQANLRAPYHGMDRPAREGCSARGGSRRVSPEDARVPAAFAGHDRLAARPRVTLVVP